MRVLLQGQEHEHQRDRAHARGRHDSPGQRPQVGPSPPHLRPADQRRGWISGVVGALRPRDAGARHGQPGSLRAVSQGPILLEQADGGSAPAARRVLRAGDRTRPGLCARPRGSRRVLRAILLAERDLAPHHHAQGEGGGLAGAGDRRVAGRGPRRAGGLPVLLRLGSARERTSAAPRHRGQPEPRDRAPLAREHSPPRPGTIRRVDRRDQTRASSSPSHPSSTPTWASAFPTRDASTRPSRSSDTR